MNCDQSKQISVREIMESFCFFLSKKTKTKFYYALDREEKRPSLHVDF